MTISATIIADSISPAGVRLVTMQLRYPRFVHPEVMTHRVFSRNASSSRAIPVERLIQDVLDDPAIPVFWGANQKGMQADRECFNEVAGLPRERAWLRARDQAVDMAKAFAVAGIHKQISNRLLEPFCHINVIVTATEWANFFALRCHKDAQPEMRALAHAMRAAMTASTPSLIKTGEWHLPYVVEIERTLAANALIMLSTARCARVSYLMRDGKPPDINQDLQLYERLVGSVPLHASPAEHQATPDEHCLKPELHGNFRGWIQYRKTLSEECVHDLAVSA